MLIVGGQQLVCPDAKGSVVTNANPAFQATINQRCAAELAARLTGENLVNREPRFDLKQDLAIGVPAPSPKAAVGFAKTSSITALKRLCPIRFRSQSFRREGAQTRPPIGSRVIIEIGRAPAPKSVH